MTMVPVKTSQQLQITRCSEDDSVRNHFDKLANLRELPESIPDSEYTSILMRSLTESFTAMLGSIAPCAERQSLLLSWSR